MDENPKIILFDGVCNLCNEAINFVIKRDSHNVFKFAMLQSDLAKKLLTENIACGNTDQADISRLDSIVLIEGEKCFSKSTAALHIARQLSGIYPLLYGFIILPKFIRDRVYDYIAQNRYKWFGKKESCMIPTPELKEKFL